MGGAKRLELGARGLNLQPPALLHALIHRSAWKENSPKFVVTEFSEVRSKGVGLLLYHRLCWPSRGYGVRVPMHNLPCALFGPEDARDPQGDRSDVLPPPDLGLASLYLHRVGKLGGRVLGHVLEADGLTIS